MKKGQRPSQHVRKYRTGKKTLVNRGLRRKSFFAFKSIPHRWLVTREQHRKEPVWTVHAPGDVNKTYFQLVEFGHYPSSPYGDADHDEVENLLDHKPLSLSDHRTVPPSVKRGNTKLTDKIGIFSLPRYYTCPGKTPLCRKYCYAEPPEKWRASVVYSRNKNLAWSQRPDFVRVMSEIIHNMHLPYFRIHEAGDFYDQGYFEKWLQIAHNNPGTKFLAYTKNWKLFTHKLPHNFTLRYSTDASSIHIRKDLPQCFIGTVKPENYFLCKKKCEPGFCMECWNKHSDIYIPIHSVSKADVDVMFNKQFPDKIPPWLKKRQQLVKKIVTRR